LKNRTSLIVSWEIYDGTNEPICSLKNRPEEEYNLLRHSRKMQEEIAHVNLSNITLQLKDRKFKECR
jgi:hypothetical protein